MKDTKTSNFAQTVSQIISKYEGTFSDGTKVTINQTNYDWQNEMAGYIIIT